MIWKPYDIAALDRPGDTDASGRGKLDLQLLGQKWLSFSGVSFV
jgi:hypothetical protein